MRGEALSKWHQHRKVRPWSATAALSLRAMRAWVPPDARSRVLAALGLVSVSTSTGILYKVSQTATGGFRYSTTSALAIAEFLKLLMSSCLHIGDSQRRDPDVGKVRAAIVSARSQLSWNACAQIWLLAGLYALNNQLSFYVYILADPGTINLFRAGSTIIVAAIQCICVGKRFSAEQWRALFLKGVGMVVVQYNPCNGSARYRNIAYILMTFSTMLTALCAAWNEHMLKHYNIGVNVQNIVLYSGGAVMNLLAFFCLPNPNSSEASIGFWDGYSDPAALGVVFLNAVIGLAITAVLKYADAITKCIAMDITAVLLCIVSSLFFELQPSFTMWCGIIVVCFAVHAYTCAKEVPMLPTWVGGTGPARRAQTVAGGG